jgi:hypothetical protein
MLSDSVRPTSSKFRKNSGSSFAVQGDGKTKYRPLLTDEFMAASYPQFEVLPPITARTQRNLATSHKKTTKATAAPTKAK